MGRRNASSFADVLTEKCRQIVETALARINEHDELEHVAELWPREQREAWRARQRRQQQQDDDDDETQRRRAAPAQEDNLQQTPSSTSRTYAQAAGHISSSQSLREDAGLASVQYAERHRSDSVDSDDTDDTLRGDYRAARRSDDAYRQRFQYTFEHFVEHLDPSSNIVANLAELLVGETARRAISQAIDSDLQSRAAESAGANHRRREEQEMILFRRREGVRTQHLNSELDRIARRIRRGRRIAPIPTSDAYSARMFPSPPETVLTAPTNAPLLSSVSHAGESVSTSLGAPAHASNGESHEEHHDPGATTRHARVGLRTSADLHGSSGVSRDLQSLRRRLVRANQDLMSFHRRAEENIATTMQSLSSVSAQVQSLGAGRATSQSQSATLTPAPREIIENGANAQIAARSGQDDANPSTTSTSDEEAHRANLLNILEPSTGTLPQTGESLRRQLSFVNHSQSQRRRLRRMQTIPMSDVMANGSTFHSAEPVDSSGQVAHVSAEDNREVNQSVDNVLRQAHESNVRADETLRHVMGDGAVGQAVRRNDLPVARLPSRARESSHSPASPSSQSAAARHFGHPSIRRNVAAPQD